MALYGEHARRDIACARRRIAERGYPETLEGFRAFRRDAASGNGSSALLRGITDWSDFYSTSLLRDLVFHRHEMRFTIAKIREMLEGTEARFVGFEFLTGLSREQISDHPATQMYRRRWPTDKMQSDLARWELLEASNPNLFHGYLFWCQKQ